MGTDLLEVLLDRENTQLQAVSILSLQCPCGKAGVTVPSLYSVPALAVPTQLSSSPLAFFWALVAPSTRRGCSFSFFFFFFQMCLSNIYILNFTLFLFFFYNIIYLRQGGDRESGLWHIPAGYSCPEKSDNKNIGF